MKLLIVKVRIGSMHAHNVKRVMYINLLMENQIGLNVYNLQKHKIAILQKL